MVMYVNCPGSAEEKVVDTNLHSSFTGVTKVASLKCLGLVYFCLYLLSTQSPQGKYMVEVLLLVRDWVSS